jgi:DNA-binding PadR family transcriptional regulator
MSHLTHHESHVLALIGKWQPTTAYFVRKALGQRLASDLSDSPGSVYPVIERLKQAALVTATADAADGRGTEHLRCTEAGHAAVREWVVRLEPRDMLPEDPWRTRIAFIETLAPEAARDWLFEVHDALERTLDSIEQGRVAGGGIESELEHAQARLVTAARLAWVDQAIASLARTALGQRGGG